MKKINRSGHLENQSWNPKRIIKRKNFTSPSFSFNVFRKLFRKTTASDDVVKTACDAMLEAGDDDHDGLIDRAEFKTILKTVPYDSLQKSFNMFLQGKK